MAGWRQGRGGVEGKVSARVLGGLQRYGLVARGGRWQRKGARFLPGTKLRSNLSTKNTLGAVDIRALLDYPMCRRKQYCEHISIGVL